MPFQREWDPDVDTYVINRDNTGPPKPTVLTGTIKAEDGAIVADSTTVTVPPATPVKVTLPGPNEPVIDSQGRLNPRWWRFFNELYQRTGGITDNINRSPTSLLGAGTADALALAGVAPTLKIDPGPEMSLGTLSLAGSAPETALSSPVEAPLVGTLTLTGAAPTLA